MTAALAPAPRPAPTRPAAAATTASPRPRPGLPGWAAPAAVVALAGLLRLARLGAMRDNSFYDAAVRSMGGSWHAFATGAIDPAATVSVDKPPVDLWLQVAATKLLGFDSLALHLPEAIGGTLAVVALYDLLRTLLGRRVALAGALALALLPMAVITSRSDTMDSVMAALVVAAAALVARAARDERPGLLVAAGAVLGLAFEVKLFEALVAAPAIVALWWLGSSAPRARRAALLGAAGAAFAVVALAWLVALPAVGGARRPWAFGSTNGSAWNATFVYDGLDRVAGPPHRTAPVPPPAVGSRSPARRRLEPARVAHDGPAAIGPRSPARLRRERAAAAHLRALARRHEPAPAGPLRLFASAAHEGSRTGIALGLALLVLLAALLARAGAALDRLGRAGAIALVAWMAAGAVLFSAQGSLKPRYLEAVDPAIAAVLGGGVVLLVERLADRSRRGASSRVWRAGSSPARRAITVALLAATLVAPAAVSVAAVAGGAEDAGAPGALAPARLAALERYLRGPRRDRLASLTVGAAASLIARDGRPVEILAANDARPLVTVARLRRDIAGRRVATVLLGAACTPISTDLYTGCSPLARWVRAHGTDVSRAAGQPHTGILYAFSASGRTETTRSVPLRRSRAARARRRSQASRGLHPGSGRGRAHSRARTATSAAR